MKDEVKDVFKRVLNITDVPDNLSQKNCENWDSLRHLNLIVELEDAFDVSFEPEDIAEMKDLDAVLKKIEILK